METKKKKVSIGLFIMSFIQNDTETFDCATIYIDNE